MRKTKTIEQPNETCGKIGHTAAECKGKGKGKGGGKFGKGYNHKGGKGGTYSIRNGSDDWNYNTPWNDYSEAWGPDAGSEAQSAAGIAASLTRQEFYCMSIRQSRRPVPMEEAKRTHPTMTEVEKSNRLTREKSEKLPREGPEELLRNAEVTILDSF